MITPLKTVKRGGFAIVFIITEIKNKMGVGAQNRCSQPPQSTKD